MATLAAHVVRRPFHAPPSGDDVASARAFARLCADGACPDAPRVLVVAAGPAAAAAGAAGLALRAPGAVEVAQLARGARRDAWWRGDAARRPARVHHLGLVAGELSHALTHGACELAALIAARAPDVVVAHAYEGVDADADAAAFMTHAALGLLAHERCRVPLLVEMATPAWLGDAGASPPHARRTGRGADTWSVRLAPRDVERKRQLLAAFAPGWEPEPATLAHERFHAAPCYDFARAAAGVDDGDEPRAARSRELWCALARRALMELTTAAVTTDAACALTAWMASDEAARRARGTMPA